VTQHGSFPDRPRGRRARHGNDMPDWQSSPGGHDGSPEDEREFPDLDPIRGRRLSESDNRGMLGNLGGRGRHSAPGQHRAPGRDSAPPWGDPASPQSGQQPSGQQYDQASYGQEQYGQEQYDQGQYDQRSGQQPAGRPGYDERETPRAQGTAPQSRHAARSAYADMRPVDGPASRPQEDTEVSDDPMEAFSARWARRGGDTPLDGRRRLRWMFIGGGGVAVVVIAVVAYFLFGGSSGNTGSVGFGSLVTTFLPGEIQNVPNACTAVSPSTISQYLPGKPAIAAPPLNGGLETECTWTLDSAPTYRVIEVDIHALSPSGLASGTGSATFAAIDDYANDLQVMQKPAANSGQPPATITTITGLGTTAFGATQTYNINNATTYKATVVVRYRNVIVSVVVNGLDHAVTSKGTYGPVDMTTLTAAAQQVATEAVAHLNS
jgi:hypothetical protein